MPSLLALRQLAVTIVFAQAIACSDINDVEGCLGDVDVVVQRISPPMFSWSPACGISILAIVDPTFQAVWGIEGEIGKNAIEPPIRFGAVPANATESAPPKALQPGHSYIVRVFRLQRGSNDELELVLNGEQNFSW
jgi:hypothetical protein